MTKTANLTYTDDVLPALEGQAVLETSFIRFWGALHEECQRLGLDCPTFGPAHRMWEDAIDAIARDNRIARKAD